MELRPLSAADCERVRVWRLAYPETLRTPYMLTSEMQTDWYEREVCNRESRTRYWGLWIMSAVVSPRGYDDNEVVQEAIDSVGFVGYGGMENISWENGTAEISLLIDPARHHQGLGRRAVGLFLREAFDNMRLEFVRGRCYLCSDAVDFWREMCRLYGGQHIIPLIETDEIKRWEGVSYGCLAFGWRRAAWLGCGPGTREEANAHV